MSGCSLPRCLLLAAAFFGLISSPLRAQFADADPDLGLLRDNGGTQLVGGQVRALAVQGTRTILVGGDFVQTSGGVHRTNLLRLYADGTLDPDFDVVITSASAVQINAIAVAGDAIYIGGRFDRINGTPRTNLAKLTAHGQLVMQWNAHAQGTPAAELLNTDDVVHAIAVGADAVYAGGNFTAADLWGLARLDTGSGELDAQWRAPTQRFVTATPSAGNRGEVRSLLHTGSDLVVGGFFRQIGGQPRASVARLSLNAPVAVQAYDVPINGGERYVYALALSADRRALYLGGDFFAGTSQRHLLRSDAASGALDTVWNPQPNAPVRALALLGPWLYAGGAFGGTTPQPYANLMRLATGGDGARDTSWLPNPDARVLALQADRVRRRLYLGGEYGHVGSSSRNGLARIGQVVDPDVIFYDGVDLE